MASINVSDKTHKEFKKKCVNQGLMMGEVAEHLVKRFNRGDIKYEIEYKK